MLSHSMIHFGDFVTSGDKTSLIFWIKCRWLIKKLDGGALLNERDDIIMHLSSSNFWQNAIYLMLMHDTLVIFVVHFMVANREFSSIFNCSQTPTGKIYSFIDPIIWPATAIVMKIQPIEDLLVQISYVMETVGIEARTLIKWIIIYQWLNSMYK